MARRLESSWKLALLTSGAAAALVATATPTLAQTDQTVPSTQISEVIVTAQRRSENIEKVPITISAFSGDQARKLGIESSIDIGQFIPNVDIGLPAGEGNQPIITIRGIGVNDYDTNNAGPNGVYVDEVYLSAPATQTFQTFDLDRIEVLKGPQGTLFGANTSGGAISMTTVKPTDTFAANLRATYSSFNTFTAEGGVGGPLAANLDGRFAFTYKSSDGYIHNALTNGDENGANVYGLRGILLYKPTDRLKMTLSVQGGEVDNRPNEYRHIGTFVPGTQSSPSPTLCSVAAANAGQCVDLYGYGTPKGFFDGSYERREHLRVKNVGTSLNVQYADGPLTYTSITSYVHSDKFFPEDTDASPFKLLEETARVRSNTLTQEFRASASYNRFNWTLGTFYLHENLNQNQPLAVFAEGDNFPLFGGVAGPGSADGIGFVAFDSSKQVTDSYAVYGQADYALTDRLKLTLGGRYTNQVRSFDYHGAVKFQEGGQGDYAPTIDILDSHQSYTSSAFSYRAALDYKITERSLAYASVATGFKSADFNGSFLSFDPEEIARQLKPVVPETVTAYEVGFKSSFFDRRVLVDLAAFYNDYRKLQVFVLVPSPEGGAAPPINVLDNAPKAHTDGIDLQITAKPLAGLTASLQAGLLQTRLDQFVSTRDPAQPNYTGNQLPLAPQVSGVIIVNYERPTPWGGVDLQYSASYKSKQFFDSANDPYITQNPYWISNFRVGFKPRGQSWDVAVIGKNVFAKDYYVDKFDLSAPFGYLQGIVGTPRSFGIELNYKY